MNEAERRLACRLSARRLTEDNAKRFRAMFAPEKRRFDVKVEVFVLCDAATDSQGKLNILGAFDTIFARQLPTVHPSCAIALRIRFSKIEEGNHRIRITVINQDGKPLLPPLDQAIAARIGNEMDSAVANIVLNIHGLKVEQFGEFRIDLAVDSREEGSLPLNVRQLPT